MPLCLNEDSPPKPDYGAKPQATEPHYSTEFISSKTALVAEVVCTVFTLNRFELYSGQRGKAHIAFARQVAMYLAHIGCGLSFTEVGRAFGRDRTTVAHACQLVEDKREDLDMDWSLDLMERSLLLLIAANESKECAHD